MNIRRLMRDQMILSAVIKNDQLEIKFHADAPLDVEKLTAVARANRNTMRLTPSFQVIMNRDCVRELRRRNRQRRRERRWRPDYLARFEKSVRYHQRTD
jgi:hypothetical protein